MADPAEFIRNLLQHGAGKVTPEQIAAYRQNRERRFAEQPVRLPYPIRTVPGTAALDHWTEIRSGGEGWPIVVGTAESLVRLGETFSSGDQKTPPAAILAIAEALAFPIDLLRWQEDFCKRHDLTFEVRQAPVGEWPDQVAPISPLSIASDDLLRRPRDQVSIVILPTAEGAAVPAYLRWGGWNGCPRPEYIIAALRRWHSRYGAELVGLGTDRMDLRVASRPGSREEALELASEHYLFCNDRVDQGSLTLSHLAAELMHSDWWFFWWD